MKNKALKNTICALVHHNTSQMLFVVVLCRNTATIKNWFYF